jgi:ABC-type antimicrobial peptide transport system permease subunit
VIRHVLAFGARPVAIGLALGTGLSLLAWRLIDARVSPLTDIGPAATAFAVGVLALAALAACWVPARRALRVDPIGSLRAD